MTDGLSRSCLGCRLSLPLTICFFSYLNIGFNPIICALKMRLLVFNYGNYAYY